MKQTMSYKQNKRKFRKLTVLISKQAKKLKL